MTEWLKVHAWKACVREYREFESLLLRQYIKTPQLQSCGVLSFLVELFLSSPAAFFSSFPRVNYKIFISKFFFLRFPSLSFAFLRVLRGKKMFYRFLFFSVYFA